MKRAPIVLSATAVGLAVTLGFHAHAPAAPSIGTAQTTAPGSTASTSSTAKTTKRPSTTRKRASKTTKPASTGATTVTSDVAPNQYGNVQLKVTVANGKITKVEALQVPSNDRKSVQINAYAEPILRASALSAQSANIDAVSGATYTSNSYRTALQSALDKTALASSSSPSA